MNPENLRIKQLSRYPDARQTALANTYEAGAQETNEMPLERKSEMPQSFHQDLLSASREENMGYLTQKSGLASKPRAMGL